MENSLLILILYTLGCIVSFYTNSKVLYDKQKEITIVDLVTILYFCLVSWLGVLIALFFKYADKVVFKKKD